MDLRTMSVTEAAQATGMKVKTIRGLIHVRALVANKAGHQYRISVASLEAWVHRTPDHPVPTSATRAFPEVEDLFA